MKYQQFLMATETAYLNTLIEVTYTAIPKRYYPPEKRSQKGFMHGHSQDTMILITAKNGKLVPIPIKNILTITKIEKEVKSNDTKGN